MSGSWELMEAGTPRSGSGCPDRRLTLRCSSRLRAWRKGLNGSSDPSITLLLGWCGGRRPDQARVESDVLLSASSTGHSSGSPSIVRP